MKNSKKRHPSLQYNLKKKKAIAFHLYTVLLGCFFGILAPVQAQSDLNANGQIHRINTNGGGYSEYKIPSNTNGYNTITFWLTGGDGGHRKVPGLCQTKGGEGAYVAVKFLIGNNAGQLKTGGTIRFIPGYAGESKTGNGIDGCGAGGGTGVLYHDPNANITCSVPSLNLSDAGTCWVILGVAGGGGGAYSSGACGGQEGKGGNSGTNGTDGYGVHGGNGGQNGNGGGNGGGGGGYLSDGGSGGQQNGGLKGGFSGGLGGIDNQDGGYGYGGGGGGATHGGGGGGYSGGGSGASFSAGGSGGSFANSSANYSKKTAGGTTNSPSDGHVDYVFQVGATAPVAVCKNITVALNANGNVVYYPIDLDSGSFDPNGDPLTYSICYVSFGVTCYDSVTRTCSNLGPNTEILYVNDGTDGSFCFSTVTVEDAIPPEVSCKSSLTVVLDATGHATIAPGDLIISSSDNCGIVSQTLSKSSFDCSNAGNNTVAVTVADASDNSATCTATVIVQDYTFSSCQPDFNVTVPSGACEAYVNLPAPAFSSGCGYTLQSRVCATNQGPCTAIDATSKSGNYAPGGYYIQWIIYKNGNQVVSFCNTSFNVLPNTDPPTALCKNPTVQLDATGHATITTSTVDNGSSDICGPVTESINISNFDCTKVGNNTVTLTVTNSFGNTKTCTSTVTVQDKVVPNALCKNSTIFLDPSGTGGITPVLINNGSTDACGISLLTLSKSTFNCSNVGANTVTLSVKDVNNNTGTCNATVTVQDLIAPATLCKNKTVQLNASGQGSITTADINNGSTDACGIANLSLSKSSFNCSNVGTNIVTLSATDVNGNTGTCTATVTVQDIIAPTALCHSTIVNLNPNGTATLPPAQVDNGSSDVCGIQTMTVSPSLLTCNELGATTVTLTVTDIGNNTATCTTTVTVKDITPPVADCKNITAYIDNSESVLIDPSDVAGPNIFDACEYPDLELDFNEFFCYDLGERTVTLTLTDGSGNSSYCQAIVTVIDASPPQMHCKSDPFILELDANGAGFVTFEAIDDYSYDNCSGPAPYLGGNLSLSMIGGTYTCTDIGDNVVTLMGADENGNTATCTATISVVYNHPPTAICQNATVSLDANGSAVITASTVNNGSSNNCVVQSLVVSPTDFTCGNIGANTVTLTVTDVHGATASCTATVTIVDANPPTVVCKPFTTYLNAAGAASITTADVFQSGSDNCGTVNQVSVSPNTFNCNNFGANIVMLTANDGHGNTGTCIATVTVFDAIPPTVVCKPYTANLDAAGNASVTTANVFQSGADNCGNVIQASVLPNAFNCSNIGANLVTLTVTDGHGNSGTCTSTVTVVDAMPPTMVCKPYTANLDAAGNASVTTANVFQSGADNCGTVNQVSVSPNAFNCSNIGANIVTLTANDGHGNTGTCTATVTVADAIPPTVVCKPYTANLDAAGNAGVTTANVFLSGADNCGTVNQASVSPNAFNCNNLGSNLVTLTVNDGHGNTGTCTATITVVDAMQPTVICKPFTTYLNAAGAASITTADVFQSGTDNCSTVNQQSVSPAAFNCGNIGTNTVTLTVNDGHGNTGTCTATVTVVDAIAPSVVCKPYTANLDATGNASVATANVFQSGTDNCGTVNQVSVSPNAFNCSNIGANIVTLTVNDSHGNTNTCTATVTVVDAIPPTVVCHAITTFLNAVGSVGITADDVILSSTDNCGTVNLVSVSPNTFNCSNIGANLVTLTANDGHGNSGTCTTTVTVVDAMPPTVVCKSYTANLDATGNVVVAPANVFQSGADNCGTVNPQSVVPGTLNCSNIGTNTVTLTANDGHGNTATCTATVTVVDAMPPSVVCNSITTFLNAAGAIGITADDVFLSGADNCGTVNLVSVSPNAFTCSNLGANIVTLTANDGHGNTNTCTATVTVVDAIPPTVVCKPFTTYLNAAGTASITTADVFQSAADNCGTVNQQSVSPGTLNCGNIGTNTVTLTVNDGHGNTGTCTATVTVIDAIQPTVVCKAYTANLDAAGNAVVATANVFQSGTDNCGTVNPVSVTPNTFNCSNLGANTVTLTVNDGNGNTNTCTATVTVADANSPTMVCHAITTFLNAAGSVGITADDVFLSGTDNCGTVTLVSVLPNAFNCSNIGANLVTLTANDGHGNTGTCTTTVTVVDAMPPTVVCKPYTTNLDAAGSASVSTGNVFLSGTDNCGMVNQVSVSPNTFNCSNLGLNTVTLTVNDGHGNTNTCTASVIVADAMAPTVVCKTYTAYLGNAGSASITTGDVFQSGFDNCGTVNQVSVLPNTFQCSNIGANTVTLMVNDGHGNTNSCTATVTVADAIAPTVVCKTYTAFLNAVGSASITTGNVFQSGMDNCGVVNQQSVSPNSFNCSNIGVNVVTLTVNDSHGNTSTCNATIMVVDAIEPSVVCRPYTAYLDNAGAATITTGNVFQSGSDNCGVVNQQSVSPSTFNCGNLGANTVTLTVNDSHGNTGTCTATVTVVDAIAPTMLCKNVTLNLDATGQATLSVSQVNNGSYDNCSINFMRLSQDLFTCANIGSNTVTLGGKDASNNWGQCSATILVEDHILPVAKCKNVVANIEANGTVTVPGSAVDNGSTDNCSITFSLFPNTFNCGNIGLNAVTLTAMDGGGNTASCAATVTVRDISPPVAKCKNTTVYIGADGHGTLGAEQMNNESTDNCGIASWTLSQTAFNCSDLSGATYPVTMTIRDMNGNSSSCTAYVTVKDIIAPTAVCEDVTVKLGSNGTVVVFGAELAFHSTDNCSVWSYSPVAKVYTTANLGANNLTVTVKDWSGNSASCVSVVTVLPSQNLLPTDGHRGPAKATSNNLEFGIRLYPNPTAGDATLEFDLPGAQNYELVIYDLTGRIVLMREGEGEEGRNSLPIQSGNITPGVYFLELRSAGLKENKRLIVQE